MKTSRYFGILILFIVIYARPALAEENVPCPAYPRTATNPQTGQQVGFNETTQGWEPMCPDALLLNKLHSFAERGNANAQQGLGLLYMWGRGVPQDHKLAAGWFLKSANQGNVEAAKGLAALQQPQSASNSFPYPALSVRPQKEIEITPPVVINHPIPETNSPSSVIIPQEDPSLPPIVLHRPPLKSAPAVQQPEQPEPIVAETNLPSYPSSVAQPVDIAPPPAAPEPSPKFVAIPQANGSLPPVVLRRPESKTDSLPYPTLTVVHRTTQAPAYDLNSVDSYQPADVTQPHLATQKGFEVGIDLSRYGYHEEAGGAPFMVEKIGYFAGIEAAINQPLFDDWFFRGETRYAIGDANYSSASGPAKGQATRLWETRLMVGRDFAMNNYSLSPYIGYGARSLYNDMRDGAGGYRRQSQYDYIPLGITHRFGIKERISTNLEYDYFLSGTQRSYLSDADPQSGMLLNNQSKALGGAKGSILYERGAWSAGPWFNYWHILDSDTACSAGAVPVCGQEPENTTTEVGIKVVRKLW